MKRLISHVRLLFNIQLVHLFHKTFETARYNMIIHVIVFLLPTYHAEFARNRYPVQMCRSTILAVKMLHV